MFLCGINQLNSSRVRVLWIFLELPELLSTEGPLRHIGVHREDNENFVIFADTSETLGFISENYF